MKEFEVGDRVEARGNAGQWHPGTLGSWAPSTVSSQGIWDVTMDSGQQGWRKFPENLRHVPLPAPEVNPFAEIVAEHLIEIEEMMVSRHKKYGPGNIAEFGESGLLVRLSDKMARLKNNREDFSDESVDDTVSDIIGYSLIWKMWRAGDWPE